MQTDPARRLKQCLIQRELQSLLLSVQIRNHLDVRLFYSCCFRSFGSPRQEKNLLFLRAERENNSYSSKLFGGDRGVTFCSYGSAVPQTDIDQGRKGQTRKKSSNSRPLGPWAKVGSKHRAAQIFAPPRGCQPSPESRQYPQLRTAGITAPALLLPRGTRKRERLELKLSLRPLHFLFPSGSSLLKSHLQQQERLHLPRKTDSTESSEALLV